MENFVWALCLSIIGTKSLLEWLYVRKYVFAPSIHRCTCSNDWWRGRAKQLSWQSGLNSKAKAIHLIWCYYENYFQTRPHIIINFIYQAHTCCLSESETETKVPFIILGILGGLYGFIFIKANLAWCRFRKEIESDSEMDFESSTGLDNHLARRCKKVMTATKISLG